MDPVAEPDHGVVAGWRWAVLDWAEPVLGQMAVSVGVALLFFVGRAGILPPLRAHASRTRSDGTRGRQLEGLSKRTESGSFRPPTARCATRVGCTRSNVCDREHRAQHDGIHLGAPRRLVRGAARARSSGSSAANGAGKSTLLKILTRITTPTEGRARDPRPGRQPARGRDRVPPRADRPREHLPERLDSRDEAARDHSGTSPRSSSSPGSRSSSTRP